MRIGAALLFMLVTAALSAPPAHAEKYENVMAGPVFGWRIGGPSGARAILGLEGGIGLGPERLNVGHEWRFGGPRFMYVELDPWFIIGGTLGFGIDTAGQWSPVLGVWEGIPLKGSDTNRHCDDDDVVGWHTTVSVAAGYRFAGVHELYVTVKGGAMDGEFCFD